MVYDKGKVGCLAKRLGLPVDIFTGYRSLMNDIWLQKSGIAEISLSGISGLSRYQETILTCLMCPDQIHSEGKIFVC